MTTKRCRGQSMVEMALIAPMFFLLIFAVFDVGRGIVTYNLLSNVAREGARYAATHAIDSTGACNASSLSTSQLQSTALAMSGPFAGSITVTTPSTCVSDAYGTYYIVKATMTFQPLTALIIGQSLTLATQSKMYMYLP